MALEPLTMNYQPPTMVFRAKGLGISHMNLESAYEDLQSLSRKKSKLPRRVPRASYDDLHSQGPKNLPQGLLELLRGSPGPPKMVLRASQKGLQRPLESSELSFSIYLCTSLHITFLFPSVPLHYSFCHLHIHIETLPKHISIDVFYFNIIHLRFVTVSL